MRMTLDWDEIDEKEFEKRLGKLVNAFSDRPIYWRRSPSGKGYHVKVHDLYVTFEEMLELRERFQDDKKRLSTDKARYLKLGLPHSVLFKKKGDLEAGEWKMV